MTPTAEDLAQQGKYVQANGLNIFYEEYGSGKPLILLHGGTRTSSIWQPHIPSLSKYFRVITPDSRGHGKTNNPTGEMTYRIMAQDIAAFIQALDITKPFICGKSDGGQITLEIGMRYPNLTAALVVAAAWYKFSETYLNLLKASPFEGPGVVNFERMQNEFPGWVDELRTTHARIDDPENWQALLKQISTLWWTPLDYTAEDFQKIVDPTLILMGDRDETVPVEQAIDMYRLIRNAELAILPNTTHDSTISELSMNIVLDFLVRHGASI